MEKSTAQKSKPIKSFTDLEAWQSGRRLVWATYKAAGTFPAAEVYGLTSQMKRASVSIASNIAEGFKRDTMRDKLHFFVMAHGSLAELQNQLIIAQDLTFIGHATFVSLEKMSSEVDKLLTGLVRATKERL